MRILLLFASVLVCHGAPNEQIKNDKGTVLFEILDNGDNILVPNAHRTANNPALKFSIHGRALIKVDKGNSTSWTLQLNDQSKVDVLVDETSKPDVTQYSLVWHGGGVNQGEREICFHYGPSQKQSWYNAYQSMNASWPMLTNITTPRQQFNYLYDYDRINSHEGQIESLLILEHLYFTSEGFAILLDLHSPLFVRRDKNAALSAQDGIICFGVENKYPFNTEDKDPEYVDLRIRLLAGKSIRAITDFVVHDSGLLPKPTAIPDEKLFSDPFWFFYEMNHFTTQYQIEDYLNQSLAHGFSKGTLILDHWENNYGNYSLDPGFFPEPEKLFTDIKKNFHIGVPFYGPELVEENQDNQKKFFIQDSKANKPTDFVDFSNPEAVKYYADKMKSKFDKLKQVDTLHLFSHFSLNHDHKLHDPDVARFPSQLSTKYLEAAAQIGRNIISEFGFKTQHLPVMYRLTNNRFERPEQELAELIADALAVSVAGYSFVIPYSIGGFYSSIIDKPSEEIFIRTLQATALMPGMAFTKRPWIYSPLVVNMTHKYLALHQEHVPTILNLAKARLTSGAPILRPLWYQYPEDAKAYPIGDQFLLGEDILVAPVLKAGQVEREVYLPAGTWVDQHGKEFPGGQAVKVQAPLEELPYFKRKP